MQDNRKYYARFLGGAVRNQLKGAEEIILEKFFFTTKNFSGR
jgi:hypothetical protein